MTGLPFPLRLYRKLSSALQPLFFILLLDRARRKKEELARLSERRGHPSRIRPTGPLVWVHGASVGESVSLLPVIGALASRDVSVLVTSGTVTSAKVLAARLPARTTHQYVPLDVASYMRRFLDHWRPDLIILAESELWPNLMLEASNRRIPIVLANARLSERSFWRWSRLSKTARFILGRLDLCLAQTRADAERLICLGAPRVTVTGNLKFDVPPPPAASEALRHLQSAISTRPVWLAASTHPGEEAVIATVHGRLLKDFPDLLTIIAPRHPERGPEIAEAITRQGIKTTLRSQGAEPDPQTGLYIADTIGELGLFYRLAPIVFLGGSLVPHGGHNPIEPAKLGAAVIHGPHVRNFQDVYGAIGSGGGALLVKDADGLYDTVARVLADPEQAMEIGRAAQRAVGQHGGALQKILAEIAPYLLKMHLGS